MRTYHIYLIEEDVADYYYGRERMFFELFAEYKLVHGRLKEIIERQIHYITKPLPVLHLLRQLNQAFMRNKECIFEGRSFLYRNDSTENRVELHIEDDCIQLEAWGTYDSESIFFEVLRKFEGRLLAVDTDHGQYGWIKPIKTRKYV